ncbi:PhzF family phenazine biosynthesis protein [Kitasatospora azatica]|uniref:PhzF family phenazine biosynthesis protein n=1 Tax=Kitasatospora azatica TaxID=58347 RepID=UPI00055FBC69|nr:PhzF family phenazine biosynthesis protein [Kitasatospora azatica]
MTTVLRYAAFTTDPSGGNKAGVVLDATELTDDRMLAVAAELGYSETAFLTPLGGRDYRVRYFAPTMEVPFCGHATIAAAVAVAEQTGPGDLVFETKAGTVPVAVDEELRATLTSVEPHVQEVDQADLQEALAALDWSAADLDQSLPPRFAYAGARHLVLATATRERLADLSYDFDRLATFMTAHDLITLQLVWRESAAVFHVRDPFPVGGVVEDPATGAAAAAFGAYLRELGQAGPDARLTLHQGEDLGSPGLLHVELRSGDPRVRVSGAAVRLTD